MNKIFFHLGNVLIVASLAGFVFIFYPVILGYLVPVPEVKPITVKTGTFITIPKIKAQSPIIENVDPWNESVYNDALKNGVAQAKGTAHPGEKGTMFLFAHSSGLPWELTRFNTIFLKLGELQRGDEIQIVKNGKEYTYKVTDKKEVDPSQVQYIVDNQKNVTQLGKTELILQTCTPIGTAINRLLVFAEEKK